MKAIIVITGLVLFSLSAQAQLGFVDPYRQESSSDYSIELAIEYDGKLLSEWSFSGNRLSLSMGMHGDLSLKILDSAQRLTAFEDLSFSIAIKDSKSGTIRMFSDKTYSTINAEEILERCKEGESIIIITTDRQYSLRQNEVELLIGC